MTARGKRTRPADTSSRQVVLELPAGRVSSRTWAKGSARGEGPQQQRGAVVVAPAAQWVRCEDCGGSRRDDVQGRHGAMPVRGVTVATRPDWARCRHSVPLWENCAGLPVAPPCCLGGSL